MPSATARALLQSIAGNVHRERVRRGLTQEQLAEKADLALRYLQQVEKAEANLTVAVLAALADALEMKPAVLLRAAKLPEVRMGRPPKTRERRRAGR
jgi:transcriptional regulator with XRE-family HTH domain